MSILPGLPFDWVNQVLIERDDATPADVLAGVTGARARAYPLEVRLRDGIDDSFVPAPARAGLEPIGTETSMPGMVAFPIARDALEGHRAAELDIREVRDAVGLDDLLASRLSDDRPLRCLPVTVTTKTRPGTRAAGGPISSAR